MDKVFVIRKMDKLGRISIPKRIRDDLAIEKNQYFSIYLNKDNELILSQENELGDKRKVDELGRIVITASLRKELNINPFDEVEMSVKDNFIIIKKKESECLICKSSKNLIQYKNVFVCRKCIKNLMDLSNLKGK